nr:RhuM family protein [Proteiniclasticum ruminis]
MEEKLNAFLNFNERDILTGAGSISREVAKELAEKEYDKFNKKRLSAPKKDDFDMYLEEHEWTHKK